LREGYGRHCGEADDDNQAFDGNTCGRSGIGDSPLRLNDGAKGTVPEQIPSHQLEAERQPRKLIAFDEDTFDKLKQLGRDRMATFQELADEAFADLLKKHGIPIDLRDALRKSARIDGAASRTATRSATRKAKPR